MLKIEEYYIQYKQEIFYYLLSLTHDPVLSEDLLSETFLSAFQSLSTFEGKSSIKTWLFGIARNMWLRNCAKKVKTVDYDERLLSYLGHVSENQVMHGLTLERIEALLSQKDERVQSIVRLRLDGYAYQEIAERLNISESSARVIDHRCRKWLQTELIKEGYWE